MSLYMYTAMATGPSHITNSRRWPPLQLLCGTAVPHLPEVVQLHQQVALRGRQHACRGGGGVGACVGVRLWG